jgi:hypothetical protein
MAKKQESKDTGPFLAELQQLGWFRKINDTVQEGLPDVVGIFKAHAYGMEIKSIDEVPQDLIVPKNGSHPFSKIQVRELKNIQSNGGIGVGIIICGQHLNYCFPEEITEKGQVEWKPSRTIMKSKGRWDLKSLLELLAKRAHS